MDVNNIRVDELDLLNLRKIHQLTSTEEKTITLLQTLKLLPTVPSDTDGCPKKCNRWFLAKYKRSNDRYAFRCRGCKTTKSIRNGTFFQQSHLSLSQIFCIMYYWCRQEDKIDTIMHELEIGSSNTVIDWKNFCRDVCAQHYVNNPLQIGGPGHVVEIDESCFGKRKYNRGRVLNSQQWVFGGIDMTTKKCFMVPVAQRDAQTLLPIIGQYILPGTTIHSDEWRAYYALRNNPNYVHLTVNHSVNFVDRTTGVHTQHIENSWMKAKCKQKKQFGLHRSLLDSYLQEYMWRQEFGDRPFENLVKQIQLLYPVK